MVATATISNTIARTRSKIAILRFSFHVDTAYKPKNAANKKLAYVYAFFITFAISRMPNTIAAIPAVILANNADLRIFSSY